MMLLFSVPFHLRQTYRTPRRAMIPMKAGTFAIAVNKPMSRTPPQNNFETVESLFLK